MQAVGRPAVPHVLVMMSAVKSACRIEPPASGHGDGPGDARFETVGQRNTEKWLERERIRRSTQERSGFGGSSGAQHACVGASSSRRFRTASCCYDVLLVRGWSVTKRRQCTCGRPQPGPCRAGPVRETRAEEDMPGAGPWCRLEEMAAVRVRGALA